MTEPGAVRWLLRAEGGAALAGACAAYAEGGWSWWLFAALFLAPDLSALGYFAGPRAGAVAYNAAHTYLGPAALGAAGWAAGWRLGLALALIWAAHIGWDRLIGYGLKYPDGFGRTHLGQVGRRRAEAITPTG